MFVLKSLEIKRNIFISIFLQEAVHLHHTILKNKSNFREQLILFDVKL